jgi:anti-sigma regulatory factor (Ser/Thr protein kinase)
MLPSEVVSGLGCCGGGRCGLAAGGDGRTRSEWRGQEPSPYLRWPLVAVLETAACLAAVPCGRRHAREVLGGWGMPPDLVDVAELLTAELLSNAVAAMEVIGQAGPVALRLLANRERLVIEAWDCHPGAPAPRAATGDDEDGRGLAIVEALAHRWGTRRLSAHVKAVWAELLLPVPHRQAVIRGARHAQEGKAHA